MSDLSSFEELAGDILGLFSAELLMSPGKSISVLKSLQSLLTDHHPWPLPPSKESYEKQSLMRKRIRDPRPDTEPTGDSRKGFWVLVAVAEMNANPGTAWQGDPMRPGPFATVRHLPC